MSELLSSALPALSLDLAQRLLGIPTSHLSDNLARLSGVTGLQRFHGGRKLVGRARTVKVRPGDNLFAIKALMQADPGDVLLVDGGGDFNNALVGELALLYAQQRGCVGFVVDGAIRDVGAFRSHDFPCYARFATHRGPSKTGPGEIDVPVSIGGQIVRPGDVVVGDEDGVVTFPLEQAEGLIEKALQTAKMEQGIRDEIANGKVAQSWLTRVLEAQGLAPGSAK